MAYQIKILMLAFAIAFVISLIVIPILRRKRRWSKVSSKKTGNSYNGRNCNDFSHNNNRSNSIF